MVLDLAQLDALAAAVSEGTFEAAAHKLHVTPSAISQRIKALETSTGRVLLARSKPVRPTPSGEVLLRAARQVQAVTADAQRELGGPGPSEQVVVPLAVTADSLATWLVPALASTGPGIVFDLRREDQERTTGLLREGLVMAAVTAAAQPVAGCSVTSLGRMRYRARATPRFMQRWLPGGPSPANLARAPVVVFDRDDRLQDVYLRRRVRRSVDSPRQYFPGSEAFLEAVRLGLGWGMVPDLQIRPELAELVEIDPAGGVIDVKLFWQQWRLRSPVLDRVADAVREGAQQALK